ncbi:hypothetical protein ACFVYR_30845 [Streptomyces sp. NPDC058284]|uniref:hypothetical protein n=1 Tax=unclassified Streptomyces TaxID=2593676 RepID=UPI0036638DC3
MTEKAGKFVNSLRALRLLPGHRVQHEGEWLTVAHTTDTHGVTGTPRVRISWEEPGHLPLTVHAAELLTVGMDEFVDFREPLREHRSEVAELPEGPPVRERRSA